MADEDKHQLIRSLKQEFDAKQAQLRNVSVGQRMGSLRGDCGAGSKPGSSLVQSLPPCCRLHLPMPEALVFEPAPAQALPHLGKNGTLVIRAKGRCMHAQQRHSCTCTRAFVPPPAHACSSTPLPTPQVEQQRRTVEAQLRRAAFTAAQLDELPEGVSTYRAVGKA